MPSMEKQKRMYIIDKMYSSLMMLIDILNEQTILVLNML